MRVLLRNVIDPTVDGKETRERINQSLSLFLSDAPQELMSIHQAAAAAHMDEHPALRDWLARIRALAPKRHIATTYRELFHMQRAVELYARVADRGPVAAAASRLARTLKRALAEIAKLAHPRAAEIAAVDELYRNLPPLGRRLLNERYHLGTIGPNAPTFQAANDLVSGNLNDLRLVASLGPETNFILNATPSPEMIEIKTWTEHPGRHGRDLLPAQRVSQLSRAFFGQPGMSPLANFRQRTAFVRTRRKRVQIPAGHGKDEAERITIVGYDTSGSMDGDPGRFQAALIGAFVTRALSDISPSGKYRHRVLLIPFDGSVGKPFPVTNSDQALDVLAHYREKLHNTNGGTDVQEFLIQAMALIAAAQKQNGEPLAAANIILMTDGKANINLPKLREARAAIDRRTPLQAMFVAINGTNPDLVQFALDHRQVGLDAGYYREYPPDLITRILADADNLDLDRLKADGKAFYADADTGGRGPTPELYRLLAEAQQPIEEWESALGPARRRVHPPSAHLAELDALPWNSTERRSRPIERWIKELRVLTLYPVFSNPAVSDAVLDDVMTNFEQLTRLRKPELTAFERENLGHLLRRGVAVAGAK
jgi:Mg-chelatase subunit ChlD